MNWTNTINRIEGNKLDESNEINELNEMNEVNEGDLGSGNQRKITSCEGSELELFMV